MTLENLAQIGKVKPHKTTHQEVYKLLIAVRRNLKDAQLDGISPETRFDVAYKAVMQCALVALMANGFRPSTNEPGHHATVIQSLPKTVGLLNCGKEQLPRLAHGYKRRKDQKADESYEGMCCET